MDGKQNGFTLIEILVVVTIIGVLAGLVVVLIPEGRAKSNQTDCMNNVRNLIGMFNTAGPNNGYPPYSGPNFILYLVAKGTLGKDKDALGVLFCPGDVAGGIEQAGGIAAYKDIDLSKEGEYDAMTSYCGRAQADRKCAARPGAAESNVLVCDEDEVYHESRGVVVGLSNGAVKFRDKFDDYKMKKEDKLVIGEGSTQDELKCLQKQ